MSTKPILFERTEQKMPRSTPDGAREATVLVRWAVVYPPGVSLALQVNENGIDIVGGSPAFDNAGEEAVWRWQIDMAIIALRYIKQKTVVPPDEALAAMVSSHRNPEL